MPDIRVHRHQLAAGGRVEVDETDPTGLAAVRDPDAGEPVSTAQDKGDAIEAPEPSRSIQPGL